MENSGMRLSIMYIITIYMKLVYYLNLAEYVLIIYDITYLKTRTKETKRYNLL